MDYNSNIQCIFILICDMLKYNILLYLKKKLNFTYEVNLNIFLLALLLLNNKKLCAVNRY